MTKLLAVLICIGCLTSFHKPTSNECDIETFYKGLEPADGTKVLTERDDLEDAKLILVPINLDKGKYVVNVTRKSSNLYKVDNKNIYIETKYCSEYSYNQEVVLNVESSYGYTKGKIIF